jgi:hypothetical protein
VVLAMAPSWGVPGLLLLALGTLLDKAASCK